MKLYVTQWRFNFIILICRNQEDVDCVVYIVTNAFLGGCEGTPSDVQVRILSVKDLKRKSREIERQTKLVFRMYLLNLIAIYRSFIRLIGCVILLHMHGFDVSDIRKYSYAFCLIRWPQTMFLDNFIDLISSIVMEAS